MRNKKTFLLVLLVLFTLFLWVNNKKELHEIAVVKSAVIKKNKQVRQILTSTKFVTKCPKIKSFEDSEIVENEELARNVHYRKNGDIYRLRTFIEDADNGSYRKLVHYKEDADGFPQLLKLPEGKEVEPTAAYINSFLAANEIIHLEKDYRLKLKDGRYISVSEKNGIITKLNSNSDNCFFEQ